MLRLRALCLPHHEDSLDAAMGLLCLQSQYPRRLLVLMVFPSVEEFWSVCLLSFLTTLAPGICHCEEMSFGSCVRRVICTWLLQYLEGLLELDCLESGMMYIIIH